MIIRAGSLDQVTNVIASELPRVREPSGEKVWTNNVKVSLHESRNLLNPIQGIADWIASGSQTRHYLNKIKERNLTQLFHRIIDPVASSVYTHYRSPIGFVAWPHERWFDFRVYDLTAIKQTLDYSGKNPTAMLPGREYEVWAHHCCSDGTHTKVTNDSMWPIIKSI